MSTFICAGMIVVAIYHCTFILWRQREEHHQHLSLWVEWYFKEVDAK